jgi:phage terminase large subunit-like protein
VSHFRSWSSRFKLKDGSVFRLDGFQERFLEDLFERGDDGRPAYSELWLVVPEGNGKTTFFTLVALYWIEFRSEAWVPVAASARDQAVDLTYRLASGFVTRNGLTGSYRLHPGYRQVVHTGSGGALKIFASDAASGDGVDPDLAIIEELHRLVKMDLYETWSGKLEKSDGQLVIASTAGAPGSAFEEMRERIRQGAGDVTRDGCFVRAAGDGVVLHEYALPEGGDPDDLELVKAANPSARITVDTLRRKRAKPTYNATHWARFTCNKPTRDGVAAIAESEWHDAATAEPIPADAGVWLGFDVGFQHDTTAIVPLWWESEHRRQLGSATILEPPGTGEQLDVRVIKRTFTDLCGRFQVSTVVMDSSRAEDIAAWLSDELGLHVVYRAQSSKPAAEDYERFMAALRQGWLFHAGDEGLRRHALNAVTKLLPDGGARFARSSESRSGNNSARVIDALVAAAMVHSVRCAGHGDGGVVY